jgi:hypothetical protein
MPDITYEYVAQRFKPRADGEDLVLFAAPATDIRSWAGVPRKAFDYEHGFQRTLSQNRVGEVIKYFREDPKNISPTSVVVGFSGGQVKIEPLDKKLGVDLVRMRITLPDYDGMSIEELTDMALVKLKERLSKAVVENVESNVEAALAAAMGRSDEEAVDQEFDIEAESSVDGDIVSAEGRSYLADFFAQLLGFQRKIVGWPEERQLREILYSILKPAIIVDGQHRVFGAAGADSGMLLAVCGIPDSSWVENVYQFVVINQKAKPIKPAFLSSIIATSLSSEEIQMVFDRLRTSGVDVGRAEIMERVNTDPASPFAGLIDFEVEGAPGFLQFPGMSRLLKAFQFIPRTHAPLLASGDWSTAEEGWLDHFFALWRGVRSYFENQDPRLWREPSPSNPNNLFKIVALQEVQRLMLDTWADSRFFQFSSVAETERRAGEFWDGFPATFFTDEWPQKGLQTDVGRSLLRDALVSTRRNIGHKGWGHRSLKFFK